MLMILWHVGALLCEEHEIRNCTSAIAGQHPSKQASSTANESRAKMEEIFL
jgi:hypothetical protein